MVFTDPPYNVGYQSADVNKDKNRKLYMKIKNDNLTDEKFKQFISDVFGKVRLHLESKACMFVCFAQTNYKQFREGMEDVGYKYLTTIIWVKDRMVFAMGEFFHRKYEPIMFLSVKGTKPFMNKNYAGMTDVWNFRKEDYELDVWYAEKDIYYKHPTQKPIKLTENALRKCSEKGFIILDPFAGSGSTLIACEQMERICYAMELEPSYCQGIIDRWEQLTGKKAEKI